MLKVLYILCRKSILLHPTIYIIVKVALDKDGLVLHRTYNDNEQISLSVMWFETLIPAGAEEEATGGNNSDDSINLLHV
jgi:hypothetical protein